MNNNTPTKSLSDMGIIINEKKQIKVGEYFDSYNINETPSNITGISCLQMDKESDDEIGNIKFLSYNNMVYIDRNDRNDIAMGKIFRKMNDLFKVNFISYHYLYHCHYLMPSGLSNLTYICHISADYDLVISLDIKTNNAELYLYTNEDKNIYTEYTKSYNAYVITNNKIHQSILELHEWEDKQIENIKARKIARDIALKTNCYSRPTVVTNDELKNKIKALRLANDKSISSESEIKKMHNERIEKFYYLVNIKQCNRLIADIISMKVVDDSIIDNYFDNIMKNYVDIDYIKNNNKKTEHFTYPYPY